jgi:hypothetical protein
MFLWVICEEIYNGIIEIYRGIKSLFIKEPAPIIKKLSPEESLEIHLANLKYDREHDYEPI